MTDHRISFITSVQKAFPSANVAPIGKDQLWLIQNGHHTFDIPSYINSLEPSSVKKLAKKAANYFMNEIMKEDKEEV